MIQIENLSKVYDDGFEALKNVNLEVHDGEILALLGPNGAGKSTLISTICGMSQLTAGTISVGGFDTQTHYRQARALVGLVPQEVAVEPFDNVFDTVRFSRGLFGKSRNDTLIEKILKDLDLWDKRDSAIRTLSGGMKRRVLIAKALSHEPKVLFLDEPSAGVDVELRKSMWEVISKLKERGVTIILTTHYIEEAEAIADRIAVIGKGQISLVEPTQVLLEQMGQHQICVTLTSPLQGLPEALTAFGPSVEGTTLTFNYHKNEGTQRALAFIDAIRAAGLDISDLQTKRSSLEDIFMDLVALGQGETQ